jgi:hypothetical protein
MAYIFYKAINQLYNDNRLVVAAAADTIGNTGCDKIAGTGIYAGALTQQGSGEDDGPYIHQSVGKGVIFTHGRYWGGYFVPVLVCLVIALLHSSRNILN